MRPGHAKTGDPWNEKAMQGTTIICRGMIQYRHKGPLHVWEAETEEEQLEALGAIAEINTITEEEAKDLKQNRKLRLNLKN